MAAAVPYLIVGAVGLIGEWLLTPKSKAANSSQPSEMPSVNQALRGTPMFVTFGSCRVSAQLTWTKNWKAIRQASQGKGGGKGGGSGGMGSAKGGGSAGGTYEYTWDVIFNFGIVDNPVTVTKAWIGGDLVNPATVQSWSTGLPAAVDLFQQGVADVKATETFFAPGYITGDANLESWPYFTSQENGLDCAWPSTCYIGFNALQLGQSPAIPQLSVEVTPFGADAALNYDPQFVMGINDDDGRNGWTVPNFVPMIGEDGCEFFIQGGGTGLNEHRQLVNMRTSVVHEYSDTDLQGWLATAAAPDPSGYHFTNGHTVECGNTPFWLFVCDRSRTIDAAAIPPIVDICRSVLLMKRNSSGTDEVAGFMEIRIDDGIIAGGTPLNGKPLSWLTRQEEAGRVCYWLSGNVGFTEQLPGVDFVNIDRLEGVFFSDYTLLWYNTNQLRMPGWGKGFFQVNGRSHSEPFCATLFDDAPGLGVVAYFGPKEIAYLTANAPWDSTPLNDIVAEAPFATARGGNINDVPAELTGIDFSKAQKRLDGTTTDTDTDQCDFQSPMVAYVNGTFVLGFSKGYDVNTDNKALPPGAGCYVMFYTWDRTTNTCAMFSDKNFSLFDPVADMGVSVTPTDHQYGTIFKYLGLGMQPDGTIWYFADFNGNSNVLSINTVHGTLGNLFGGVDVTPPYIIKRILTSPIFGFQTQSLFGFTITDDTIDDASYQDAVLKCEADGILVAVSYTNQDSLLTILNDLLALYAGTLAEHGGKIYFDVYRSGDVPIRTIDNHHLVSETAGKAPVEVTKGAVQDGFNSVQYQYLDRKLDYKRNQVNLSDEVDIDLNGYRNKVYPSQFVMTGSLASLVAERALWSNMYGRDNYSFKLGWKDADLRPGNQITLVDSFHPSLSKGVRVVINKIQESARGVFDTTATRVYANHLTAQHGYTNTASVDPGVSGLIETAGPMQYFGAYELPAEFQGANSYIYFGYNQSTRVMGAQLYLSHDLGANYALVQDTQPYAIGGRLGIPLPYREGGFVENDVDLWVLPTSGFNVNTPLFIDDFTLDDATAPARQAGATVIVVGSEAMAMEGLTLIGQNHYKVGKLYRGWGGTPTAAINSGEFWHQQGSGVFLFPINEDDIGNKLFYKIVGYDFAGNAYDVSSVDAKDYTVRGVKWLPRRQPPSRMFVQSAVSWPSSTEFRGSQLAVTSGGCDVKLTWPLASNQEGFGSGGSGGGGFGHFALDTTSPSFRVDVMSKDGTPVSSFVAVNTFFNYSVAQNSADFGGFASEVIYKVTPFNVKGDGPVSSVRSLQLFW
jgi:hypothetical protein